MDSTLANRHQLFFEAFKFLSARDFYRAYDNIKGIIDIYKGSYIILNKLEDLLYYESERNKSETFMAWYGDNEYSAREYIDVSYVREKIISKNNKNIKDKLLTLILALHDLQETVLDKYTETIKDIVLANKSRLRSLPQVFLSYAYLDKGLSFALFLYFLSHGIFLYVDWMWNKQYKHGWKLKIILNRELGASQQFLFTLTPASELNAQGYHTVRQWCAWEIGNYYTKNKNEKYFIKFYPNYTHNMFLDSVKPMKGIRNHKIY